jgi:hypothetical protein
MYDCRGREMYYDYETQMDPRALLGLDLFRVDSECVFGVVMCLVGTIYHKFIQYMKI